MAERRKNKKKKEAELKDLDKKPSKEEYAIARYLKQKLPEKKTTLLGHKVEYFIACKAVDCLVESPWAKENKKGELNFSNRDIAIDFMAKLLDHKFFHRAKKIVVQKDSKKKKKEVEEPAPDTGKEKEAKKSKGKASEKTEDKEVKKGKSDEKDTKKGKSASDEKEGKKSDEKEGKNVKTDEKEGKKENSEGSEKKKEKKKIKLDMHLDQCFIDTNEPYVWIYDPIPLRTWITGTLMVIAAVLLCLFPLWPQTIRHYIYYLSVAAAFFLIFIIGLAVLRLVVFVLVWVLTFGKHHLWLLPNLTEDVGFFESFWPLYKYEYKGGSSKATEEEEEKNKKKADKKEEEDKESATKKDPSESESTSKNSGETEPAKDESESEEEQSDSEQRKSDEEEEEEAKTENGFEFLEAEESEEEEEDRKTK